MKRGLREILRGAMSKENGEFRNAITPVLTVRHAVQAVAFYERALESGAMLTRPRLGPHNEPETYHTTTPTRDSSRIGCSP